jgi:preprotein translocase subunit YajC
MSLLTGTAAYAAADQVPAQAAAQPSLIESMVPFLLIFLVMYFILIRPQAKKAKEHRALLEAIKVGDEVVTSGGIIGRVKSLADNFITLDVGNASLKVLKEHIAHSTKKAK